MNIKSCEEELSKLHKAMDLIQEGELLISYDAFHDLGLRIIDFEYKHAELVKKERLDDLGEAPAMIMIAYKDYLEQLYSIEDHHISALESIEAYAPDLYSKESYEAYSNQYIINKALNDHIDNYYDQLLKDV